MGRQTAPQGNQGENTCIEEHQTVDSQSSTQTIGAGIAQEQATSDHVKQQEDTTGGHKALVNHPARLEENSRIEKKAIPGISPLAPSAIFTALIKPTRKMMVTIAPTKGRDRR